MYVHMRVGKSSSADSQLEEWYYSALHHIIKQILESTTVIFPYPFIASLWDVQDLIVLSKNFETQEQSKKLEKHSLSSKLMEGLPIHGAVWFIYLLGIWVLSNLT